jgi:predicted nucleic acid-binding protein
VSFVVDASVLGALLFGEERFALHAARVIAGLANKNLLAPDILTSELVSVIWKKWRRNIIDDAKAHAGVAMYGSMPITLVPSEPLADAALGLAMRLEHPPYDCFYLALAIAERAKLITADAALCDRAVAAGLGEHVLWIEDVA